MSIAIVCDICGKICKHRRSQDSFIDAITHRVNFIDAITHRVKMKIQGYNEDGECTIFPKWKTYEICQECVNRMFNFITSEKLMK